MASFKLVMLFLIMFISMIFASRSRWRKSNYHSNGKHRGYSNWQRSKYNDKNSCVDKCTDDVLMPNFCDYANDFWDDPSVPLNKRNNIGMAKYLSSENILRAAKLMKLGKSYKLSYPYTNTMPVFGDRVWYTALINPAGDPLGDISTYYEIDENNNPQCGAGLGYLDQRLMTSANGNVGTQMDGLGHMYYINGEYGDWKNYLWHNGFTGTDVLGISGANYIGIQQLPPFITRAILLDVAGYVGMDPLPDSYRINTKVIENVFKAQGMSVDDIEVGDVILIYTGWAAAHYPDNGDFYFSREPGITLDTIKNIFGPKKVLLIGADNWSIEVIVYGETLSFPVHIHWIVCHGGFQYENLNLKQWTMDARNGNVPYLGAFYYAPAQITGAVAGLGTPMVVV